MATCEVIEAASRRGANLIISHEPIFYNHLDETAWLGDDEVLGRKQQLIREKGIAIFRFHDFWHRVSPDPVSGALVRDIGWSDRTKSEDPRICVIEPIQLRTLVAQLKERLGLRRVQVVGNSETTCRRIGVMPGASGGNSQMRFFRDEGIDTLIVGEISQWETNIYVRDANELGLQRSLLVLGHVQSEEPGMRVLVGWLKPRFPGLPIFHVPTPDPFLYL
jgi:putative NIF3 family GTP cyclohydrolase 1 type 2